ncbi:hypothetical protein HOE67_03135 [Candidatus Peregrinibacteria bacterium]|jgi:hypothetical protein|nr:hypothetical protein [Candidatus Peregrinibacteria bacterium]MBT4056080.1 hypothetical protein [Candidatus Peregrinibacteria bacterium]
MGFLEDFRELLVREPKHFAPRQDNENCDYSPFCYKSKDCYLCFGIDYCEDCFHLYHSKDSKDCCDAMMIWDSELCYENMDSSGLYNSDFCWNSVHLTDCFLCEDCRGCNDCFGCSGLRRKKYYIFNKEYSKKEYVAKVEELRVQFFDEGGWEDESGSVFKEFTELRYSVPHLEVQNLRCEDCVADYCEDCKGCYWCFDSKGCEDCMYTWGGFGSKDSADIYYVHNGELCYDCMSADGAFNLNYSFWGVGCRDCSYCYCIHQCEHCFGCTNLKHKKYCILNKQYSKEEYFRKRDEVIAELRKQGLYGENLIYLALKEVGFGFEK